MFSFFKKTKQEDIKTESEYLKECSDEELNNAADIEDYFVCEYQKGQDRFKNGFLSTGAIALGLFYVTSTDNVLKKAIFEYEPRETVSAACSTFYTIADVFCLLSVINGLGLCHAQKEVNKHKKIQELVYQEMRNRQQHIK